MKIKSNSLYSELGRAGIRDEFFVWYLAENPGYREIAEWMASRGVRASDGALWTLVNRHIAVWKVDKAIEGGEEEGRALPPDVDDRVRERVKALRFDLVLSDLTAQQKLAYLVQDHKERELELKAQNLRDAGVQALMEEAEGNDAAKAALQTFLSALDASRQLPTATADCHSLEVPA